MIIDQDPIIAKSGTIPHAEGGQVERGLDALIYSKSVPLGTVDSPRRNREPQTAHLFREPPSFVSVPAFRVPGTAGTTGSVARRPEITDSGCLWN